MERNFKKRKRHHAHSNGGDHDNVWSGSYDELRSISAIPASAEVYYPHEEDVEIELDKGNVDLYNYLKSITPRDKRDLLVQQGDKIEFDTSKAKPVIEEDGSNLVVTSRSVETMENNTADIATLGGIVGDLYPVLLFTQTITWLMVDRICFLSTA